ncbi:hypothetical protein [Streptomyces jeddahensis]|nr:hypothetical protein [Streptomyces jeddahensis]
MRRTGVGRWSAEGTEAITGSDKLNAAERAHLAGQLSTKPGLKRDQKKFAAEEKLDGNGRG